jgi:solute carrier family 29 (equilibrative nucleoside transporter), member 1/2/3
MERIRRLFTQQQAPAYEPLEGGSEGLDGEQIPHPQEQQYSWINYGVFLLLGVAMLWAW